MKKETMEKGLIEYNKKGIFAKIKDFIKNLFVKGEDNNDIVIDKPKIKTKLQDKYNDTKELINLQTLYENGEVSENELSKEQKNNLRKLYNDQIDDLDIKIKQQKAELDEKVKIVNEYYKKVIELKRKNGEIY